MPDIETLFTLTPLVLACIPATVGLVAIVRGVGLPSAWAPVVSILIGAGLVALTSGVWQVIIAQGILVGLCASGLWSGGTSTGKAVVSTFQG